MEKLVVGASVENLDAVTGFVEETLERYDCPIKAQFQIKLAVEEIFVNIANYAYEGKEGTAEVRVRVRQDPLAAEICLVDSGKPFDPLKRDDPDLSMDAMLDRVGGLGIFLVKKTMDEVSYRYENGCNMLTFIKRFV